MTLRSPLTVRHDRVTETGENAGNGIRGGKRMDSTVVVGAGPAGLTAAYELARRGHPCEVFEADRVVGGISRTEVRNGWRFDIGGHRFFTKVSRGGGAVERDPVARRTSCSARG